MIFVFLLTLFLLFYGIIEKKRYLKSLKKIRVRIQVNGIRGKSTMVKMIVDLFSNAGWSVAGRVTGETPQFYVHDSGWQDQRRKGQARIKEVQDFVSCCDKLNRNAIIVENMALAPEYQYILEKEMLKSTTAVITNFRPDHLEVIGRTREEIIETLSLSLPANGNFIIVENCCSDLHQRNIELVSNGSNKTQTKNGDQKVISDPFEKNYCILERLSDLYDMYPNWWSKTVADWRKKLLPQNYMRTVKFNGKDKIFIDLFTCNDIESTEIILKYLEDSELIHPPYGFILTCRENRPLRTMSFLEWISVGENWTRLQICGSYPALAVQRSLSGKLLKNQQVKKYLTIQPEKIIDKAFENNDVVVGVGNYVRTGEKILSYLEGIQNDS